MWLYLLPRFVDGPDTENFFQRFHAEMSEHWWHFLVQIRNFFELKRTNGSDAVTSPVNSVGEAEEIDFGQVIRDVVAAGLSKVPRSLLRKLLAADVRFECSTSFLRTMRAFQNLEPWALRPGVLNLLNSMRAWQNMLVPAAFNSVDTFFFLRMCVPLFFVIMWFYLLPRIVDGPDTETFFQRFYADMSEHWWHLLVQIRNFFKLKRTGTLYFGVLVWCLVFSYFVFIACEAPTAVLDKLILGRLTRGGSARSQERQEQHLEGGDSNTLSGGVEGDEISPR
ncbi:hypothetical protein HPB52_022673 [Rhipicephalus sanguineus]|uniref:Uncharacterized protein n=1 Tax=Rhipicephalus sanguineus TaxID=34632 RepID=A0A9D4PY14_RHISA|nr:hypothetical protein HPB52_022673 [Rhipicephalus sanguineus]